MINKHFYRIKDIKILISLYFTAIRLQIKRKIIKIPDKISNYLINYFKAKYILFYC